MPSTGRTFTDFLAKNASKRDRISAQPSKNEHSRQHSRQMYAPNREYPHDSGIVRMIFWLSDPQTAQNSTFFVVPIAVCSKFSVIVTKLFKFQRHSPTNETIFAFLREYRQPASAVRLTGSNSSVLPTPLNLTKLA
jgi:hypothetical protein